MPIGWPFLSQLQIIKGKVFELLCQLHSCAFQLNIFAYLLSNLRLFFVTLIQSVSPRKFWEHVCGFAANAGTTSTDHSNYLDHTRAISEFVLLQPCPTPISSFFTLGISRTSNKKLIWVHLKNLCQWILQFTDKQFYSQNLDWVVQVHYQNLSNERIFYIMTFVHGL